MKRFLLIIFIVIFLAASFVTADSLIFYESFDDISSIITNGGSYSGFPVFSDGILGNSIQFQGFTIQYPVLNNLDINEGTISFWVKPISFNNQYGNCYFDLGYVSSSSSMGIFRNWVNNVVYFEVRDDNNYLQQISESNAVSLGNWTNIVVAYRFNSAGSGVIRLYINGFWGDSLYWDMSFNPADLTFTVGDCGYYSYANSYIDELKIYDYIRSYNQIKQDYYDIINYTPPTIPTLKPQSKGPVKINSSGLFVNNKSFFIKGVGYQPIPICETDGYDFFSHPEIYNRDFALLRNMSANIIRTWATVTNKNFLDAAYNNGIDPIYIIMGFFIRTDNIDYSDPATRQTLKNDFKNYVSRFKDHPAILMWAIGNENNLHYSGDMSYWYSLVNEMAKDAYTIEGELYHPVAIVNGDLGYIGNSNYNADDASLNYTDIWGVNAYRGYSFIPFFSEYSVLSSKPLWISEFGIDALDNRIGGEYEETQADWDLNMWEDIANSDITIGGTVMEYSDEWQKDWVTNDPCEHTKNCAYITPNHPDGCSNEEWYGVMRTVNNGNNPDIMQPRKVYYALQYAWGEKAVINISLKKGWNLISIPLTPPNISVSSIFNRSIPIYAYNGSWFVPKNIDNKLGYWVKANQSLNLTLVGTEIENKTINLNKGWNLVGYPYLEEKNVSELFDNVSVYSYNGSWLSYIPKRKSNSLQTLKSGYGYWAKKK